MSTRYAFVEKKKEIKDEEELKGERIRVSNENLGTSFQLLSHWMIDSYWNKLCNYNLFFLNFLI